MRMLSIAYPQGVDPKKAYAEVSAHCEKFGLGEQIRLDRRSHGVVVLGSRKALTSIATALDGDYVVTPI
jgi:hypothetical protein